MNAFLFALVLGIGAGGLYAMLGAGIVAAFKGSGVINFAHGATAMYAAYTWSELRASGEIYLPWFDPIPTHTLNLPVRITIRNGGFEEVGGFMGQAIPVFIAMLMAAFIGLILHYAVFRPLRDSPALAKVVGSVGAMLYFQSIAQLHFGTQLRTHQGILPTGSINNFLGLGANLGIDRLFVAGAALVMGGGVAALYRFTSFGLATRAADENEKGATLLGYSAQRLALLNWVLSSLMAGAAGLLYVGIATLTPGNYSLFVIPALTAALLGNLNSVWLATIGGLGLGIIQSAMVNLAGRSWWPDAVPANAANAVVPLIVVVAFLYLRGDKLPVRGSLSTKGHPAAPKPQHPYIAGILPIVLALGAIGIFTGAWEVAFTTSLVVMPIMLSLVVITGYLGQISLVQTSLAGVAAFAMIRLASDGSKVNEFQFIAVNGPGLPMILAIILGVTIATVVGVLIALPALRIRGVQLAVVTLTAVAAIRELFLKNEVLAGEGAKSNNPVPNPDILGIDLRVQNQETLIPDRWQFSVFALVSIIILCIAVANLRRGGTGRRFLAIRANERAAAAAGINVSQNKLIGFGVAAAIAGYGGVLTAFKLTSISFENYNVFVGIAILAFAYLGGISMVSGSVNGGLLAAGGLVSHFIVHHFDNVNTDYILAVGALGLIFNAILTNGEGIAMLSRQTNAMLINWVRYADVSDWRTLGIRIAPTVAISLVLGWIVWARHEQFQAGWMLLLAVYIGMNLRGLIMGIKRRVTKTGGMIHIPPPTSPAWGPKQSTMSAGGAMAEAGAGA